MPPSSDRDRLEASCGAPWDRFATRRERPRPRTLVSSSDELQVAVVAVRGAPARRHAADLSERVDPCPSRVGRCRPCRRTQADREACRPREPPMTPGGDPGGLDRVREEVVRASAAGCARTRLWGRLQRRRRQPCLRPPRLPQVLARVDRRVVDERVRQTQMEVVASLVEQEPGAGPASSQDAGSSWVRTSIGRCCRTAAASSIDG